MVQASWQDLVKTADEGPEPVPDGPYNVQVEAAEGKTSGNGKPMVVAKFKVLDGPYAGKTIWNNFVLSMENPNALGYFFRHMEAMGISQAEITQLPPPEQGGMESLAQRLIGKYATISVGHRMWQGQKKNQVGDVKPYVGTGGAVQAPAPAAPAPAPAPAAAPQTPPTPPQAPPAPPVPPTPPQAPSGEGAPF